MADEVGNGEIGTVPAENSAESAVSAKATVSAQATASAHGAAPGDGAVAGDNGGGAAGPLWHQDERTVQRLRFGIGAIGLLLPLVLPFGNWIFVQLGHHTEIMPSSMSSSYYTSTRNIFVGGLCALGVFLLGYRTTTKADLWSTVVGLFAIGVALFPTAPHSPNDYQSAIGYVHLSFAGILLAGLGIFCIVSFHRETNAGKETKNYGYVTSGVLILVFLATAVIAGLTHWGKTWTLTPLYACEALSVWAFGAAWIAAALEIDKPWSAAARNRRRASSQGPGVSSVLGQPL